MYHIIHTYLYKYAYYLLCKINVIRYIIQIIHMLCKLCYFTSYKMLTCVFIRKWRESQNRKA
jgi:hypothetical protein